MASLRNAAVVKVENTDDDSDDSETEPSPSTFSTIVALPCSSISNASTPKTATAAAASPEPKRQRTEQLEEKKALDDSRKLFQRLWPDEAEIGLLQGFLDYTAQPRGTSHNDTALFYDQIKSKLQLGFDKYQYRVKLRTLKRKYHRALSKIVPGKELVFKSPHDQATFEISRKIWGNTAPIGGSVEDEDEINTNPNLTHTTPLKNDTVNGKKAPQKRLRTRTEERRESNDSSVLNNDNNNNNNNDSDNNNDNCNGRNSIPSLIEEKVRSCLSPPVLNELASSAMGSRSSPFGFALNSTMPSSFSNMVSTGEMLVDEKWRKQQILELEVYSKRLELVQEDVKVALEKLRSAGGVGN